MGKESSFHVPEREEGVQFLYGWSGYVRLSCEDASEIALYDLLGKDEQMTFVYDFGDNWRHMVKMIDSIPYEKDEKYIPSNPQLSLSTSFLRVHILSLLNLMI